MLPPLLASLAMLASPSYAQPARLPNLRIRELLKLGPGQKFKTVTIRFTGSAMENRSRRTPALVIRDPKEVSGFQMALVTSTHDRQGREPGGEESPTDEVTFTSPNGHSVLFTILPGEVELCWGKNVETWYARFWQRAFHKKYTE